MQAEVTDPGGLVTTQKHAYAGGLAVFIFVGLQGLDLMTTLIVFSRGGVELNPVVRSLIPWLGQLPAIIASKAVVLSLILLLNRRKSILRFANLLYTAVVAWNVITMLVMK